jgi:hypothetical protein
VRLAAVTAMATESLSIGGSHDRPTMTRPGIKVPGPAGVLRDAKQHAWYGYGPHHWCTKTRDPVTPSRHRRLSLVIWIALYGSTMGPTFEVPAQ